jgi:hypothetical protein
MKPLRIARVRNCAEDEVTRLKLECAENSFNKSFVLFRHAGENRHLEGFENAGFRVAPAIAGLPGMTIKLSRTSRQDTSLKQRLIITIATLHKKHRPAAWNDRIRFLRAVCSRQS